MRALTYGVAMSSDPRAPFTHWVFADDRPDDTDHPVVISDPAREPTVRVVQQSAEPAAPSEVPWDTTPEEYERGVAIGPLVKTEQLYRPPAAPDTAEPVSRRNQTSGDTPDAAPRTIDPVHATSAEPRGSDQPTAGAMTSGPANQSTDNASGISTLVVFLIIAGATTLAGFADMFINRQFTWLSGVTFVVASIIAALLVRQRDLWTAVIAPPLAYLTALLIAGQPSTLTSAGSLIIREVSLVGTGLAFNAPYIFGGTLAALIVVLIRRSSFRKKAAANQAPPPGI